MAHGPNGEGSRSTQERAPLLVLHCRRPVFQGCHNPPVGYSKSVPIPSGKEDCLSGQRGCWIFHTLQSVRAGGRQVSIRSRASGEVSCLSVLSPGATSLSGQLDIHQKLGLDTERMFVYNIVEQMSYWRKLFIRRKEAKVWQRTCLNARKISCSSSRNS
jgi:hypothetical protein